MLSDISYYVVLLDLCTVLQLKVKSEKIRKLKRGHSTTTWTRRGGGVSQKSTLVHSGGGGP